MGRDGPHFKHGPKRGLIAYLGNFAGPAARVAPPATGIEPLGVVMKTFLASALMAAALAGPASANRFVATFTGTVTNGTDSANVFNQAGADLTGQSFTAVFTLDDSAADFVLSNGAVYYDIYNGGPANPIHATISVGGVSYALTPATDSFEDYLSWTRYSGGTFDQFMGNVARFVDDGTVNTLDSLQLYGNASLDDFLGSPLDYHTPFAHDFTSQSGGSFSIGSWSDSTNAAFYSETLNLNVSRITYAAAPAGGAVPEPASWAMMLVGFGLAGTALRRNRAKLRFA